MAVTFASADAAVSNNLKLKFDLPTLIERVGPYQQWCTNAVSGERMHKEICMLLFRLLGIICGHRRKVCKLTETIKLYF